MPAAWPTELPQRLLINNFATAAPNDRLITAMEFGPQKIRRRNSRSGTPVTLSFFCNIEDYARFLRFWHNEIAHGTQAFTIEDQVFNGEPTYDENGNPLLDELGDPVLSTAYWACQFTAAPDVSPETGRFFKITMQLEILP